MYQNFLTSESSDFFKEPFNFSESISKSSRRYDHKERKPRKIASHDQLTSPSNS